MKFEEVEGPTLVSTTGGGDIFSHGRFWIEPDTGRVLISEMITEDDRVRGELLVSYQSQPLLGLLVPIELRERYTRRPRQRCCRRLPARRRTVTSGALKCRSIKRSARFNSRAGHQRHQAQPATAPTREHVEPERAAHQPQHPTDYLASTLMCTVVQQH